jgi:subtilisin family serine protease
VLAAALVALACAPTAQGATAHDWNAAVGVHRAKVPAEFGERLGYALPDGTLRVMVALDRRDAATKAFVRSSTTWLAWYGGSPRFLGRVTPAQLSTLLGSQRVRFVEPDYPLVPTMSGAALDTHARGPGGVWSFDPAAGPLGALTSGIGTLTPDQAAGKGATVAIIDSGIDETHKDFGGFDCVPQPYQPCNSRIKHTVVIDHLAGAGADFQGLPTTEAASGHGTHVAGIIAGNGYYTRDGDQDQARYGGDGFIFGVAPQASLVSVKNGDTLWAGLSSYGLQWVLDHHAEYGIRAINNSWGCLGGCSFNGSSATAQQFKDLYEAGVLVLFAAGNDAGGADGAAFSGNAQSPYVLGVAAYNHVDHRLADFSSRGVGTTTLADPSTWTPESEGPNGVRRPDVAAPGVSIWSARTLTGGAASVEPRANANDVTGGGSSGFVPYAQMSGTSMATPHVAGAAALLVSACPEAGTLDLMRAIMAGAVYGKVLKTDGSAAAEPFEAGYGGLDVRASMDWLGRTGKCANLNQAPVATFTAPDSVRDGETATYDASGSSDAGGRIVGYRFDFGDGTTRKAAAVQHAYEWPGTYQVKLTVTDDGGLSTSATRTVTVRDEAAPGFTRVRAQLNHFKCDTTKWQFEITKITAPPASVTVTWVDGSRGRAALVKKQSSIATYRTTQSLGSVMTLAKADVPSGWTGNFRLTSGPC